MIDINNSKIILFDGVCNLCNQAVQFIIKRDKKAQFIFGSLQSDAGQELLLHFQLKNNNFNSIIFIENGIVLDKSTAILKIYKQLSGAWPLTYGFIIIPKFIRDFIYTWISNNRYKWFGKRDQCMLPTEALKARFI